MHASGVRLWLILWKAYEAMQEHARRHIHSLGIGMTGFGVLEMLLHKGPLPVNVIGARLRLTSGSMTAAVDRLESKGLVQRRNDPEDRRTRIVSLTPSGEALIAAAFEDHAAAMETAASGLTPEERDTAVELLKKLGVRAQSLLEDLPHPTARNGGRE